MPQIKINSRIASLNEEVELLKQSRRSQDRRTPIGARNIQKITDAIRDRMEQIKQLEDLEIENKKGGEV